MGVIILKEFLEKLYDESPAIRNIFKKLYNGEKVLPTKENGVYKVKKNKVFFFTDKPIYKIKIRN
jgi:hypothetical protein